MSGAEGAKGETTMQFEKFAVWADVFGYLAMGATLHYQAPMDARPRRVRIVRIFKNAKLRIEAGDLSFTADEGHLSRFRREVIAA